MPFDLGRLISRQKVAEAASRLMRSTLATSLQSNPLLRAPSMVRHSHRNIATSVVQTRVGDDERRNFIG